MPASSWPSLRLTERHAAPLDRFAVGSPPRVVGAPRSQTTSAVKGLSRTPVGSQKGLEVDMHRMRVARRGAMRRWRLGWLPPAVEHDQDHRRAQSQTRLPRSTRRHLRAGIPPDLSETNMVTQSSSNSAATATLRQSGRASPPRLPGWPAPQKHRSATSAAEPLTTRGFRAAALRRPRRPVSDSPSVSDDSPSQPMPIERRFPHLYPSPGRGAFSGPSPN